MGNGGCTFSVSLSDVNENSAVHRPLFGIVLQENVRNRFLHEDVILFKRKKNSLHGIKLFLGELLNNWSVVKAHLVAVEAVVCGIEVLFSDNTAPAVFKRAKASSTSPKIFTKRRWEEERSLQIC